MRERKRGLAGSTAIAALLALAGTNVAAAHAAPPAAKKAVTKKTAKKPVKKAAGKAPRKPAVKTVIVYVPAPPAPPVYVAAPPAQPASPPAAYDVSLYRYIDDADALLDTVGASPPDYAFRFDGIDCWAWALSGGDMVLAEPVGDHYRFYAFGPGDLYPFFIGDRDYSYGFAERAALAAVYDGDARLVQWSGSDMIIRDAVFLSERGRMMKLAAARRTQVNASDWASALFYFGDIELRFGDWRSQPGWSRYRSGPGYRRHRDWRDRLDGETARRRDRADRFDQWRRDGYRGTPPQNNGGWNTTPGRNPGEWNGSRPRPGGWNGRPNAPNGNPGVVPPPPPRDDGRPGGAGRWPGRGANPPVATQPGTPTPPPGRAGADGGWRRNGGP
ncbi:MAG: hypothetical protein JSR79_13345, partial [Proteobacteria bacterium]|nr:hypothetical protein [Pseudomonadota bacterium]